MSFAVRDKKNNHREHGEHRERTERGLETKRSRSSNQPRISSVCFVFSVVKERKEELTTESREIRETEGK